MAVRYTLRSSAPELFDRKAHLFALGLYDLEHWHGRWSAAKVAMGACMRASSSDQAGFFWAYGVWLALAGHELPLNIADSDPIAEGYSEGAKLVQVGKLALDVPLGSRRCIGSRSPGRAWLN